MKKKILLLILIPVLLVAIVFCAWNSILLLSMHTQARTAIRQNAGVQLLDSASCYGKLNGNGNGISYFGAYLIAVDSDAQLESIVNSLSGQFETVTFEAQTGQAVQSKYLANRKLQFDFDGFQEGKTYYALCWHKSHHPLSNELDLLGH